MGAGFGYITVKNTTSGILTAIAYKCGTTQQVGDPLVIAAGGSAYFNLDVSINYDVKLTFSTAPAKTITGLNAVYNPTLTISLLGGLLNAVL